MENPLPARPEDVRKQYALFGYRTVAGLRVMNKNTVQRIFQLKGWQPRRRAVCRLRRIEALPRWPLRRTSTGSRTCAGSGAAVPGG